MNSPTIAGAAEFDTNSLLHYQVSSQPDPLQSGHHGTTITIVISNPANTYVYCNQIEIVVPTSLTATLPGHVLSYLMPNNKTVDHMESWLKNKDTAVVVRQPASAPAPAPAGVTLKIGPKSLTVTLTNINIDSKTGPVQIDIIERARREGENSAHERRATLNLTKNTAPPPDPEDSVIHVAPHSSTHLDTSQGPATVTVKWQGRPGASYAIYRGDSPNMIPVPNGKNEISLSGFTRNTPIGLYETNATAGDTRYTFCSGLTLTVTSPTYGSITVNNSISSQAIDARTVTSPSAVNVPAVKTEQKVTGTVKTVLANKNPETYTPVVDKPTERKFKLTIKNMSPTAWLTTSSEIPEFDNHPLAGKASFSATHADKGRDIRGAMNLNASDSANKKREGSLKFTWSTNKAGGNKVTIKNDLQECKVSIQKNDGEWEVMPFNGTRTIPLGFGPETELALNMNVGLASKVLTSKDLQVLGLNEHGGNETYGTVSVSGDRVTKVWNYPSDSSWKGQKDKTAFWLSSITGFSPTKIPSNSEGKWKLTFSLWDHDRGINPDDNYLAASEKELNGTIGDHTFRVEADHSELEWGEAAVNFKYAIEEIYT